MGRDTYNFRPYTVRLENSLGRFMEFGIEDMRVYLVKKMELLKLIGMMDIK